MLQNQNLEEAGQTPPRLTRRFVFWCGATLVIGSLVLLTASHSLYVYSKLNNSRYDTIVFGMDILALIALIVGCVAVIVSEWFPGPQRTILIPIEETSEV